MSGGPPRYALDIINRLCGAGFQAYFVGGCVRDLLLSRSPSDWDIATDAKPEQVLALFPRSVPTGLAHGTVTVLSGYQKAEVTTFRTDGEYLDARHPAAVAFSHSLIEDLARRDFTVNAMALGADGSLVDPFGGRADLDREMIICVGEPEKRFGEDALRMLRAFRFSAVLGFRIDPRLLNAVARLHRLCARLSAERVRDEVQKILLSPRPEILSNVCRAGLLDAFLLKPGPEPAGLRELSRIHAKPETRWSGFVLLLHKQALIQDPTPFLRAMRLPEKLVRAAASGASLCASQTMPACKAQWKRLIAGFGIPSASCAAAGWDCLSPEAQAQQALDSVIASGECCTLGSLAINGSDLLSLGYPRGPAVGQALQRLLAHVIEHPEDNRLDILLRLAGRYPS